MPVILHVFSDVAMAVAEVDLDVLDLHLDFRQDVAEFADLGASATGVRHHQLIAAPIDESFDIHECLFILHDIVLDYHRVVVRTECELNEFLCFLKQQLVDFDQLLLRISLLLFQQPCGIRCCPSHR